MSDPSLLTAALLKEQINQAQMNQARTHQAVQQGPSKTLSDRGNSPVRSQTEIAKLPQSAWVLPSVRPELNRAPTEFSSRAAIYPRSGSQFYHQRLAALRAGRLYTRLPMDSFYQFWAEAIGQPTYKQWRRLLALEAKAVTRGQGSRRLSVMVGDSLSMWFPSDRLPPNQLWLNQSISGETTGEILQRLADFSQTRPETIYVMAGVNDLKQGASDNEILWNLRQITRRLQQMHPRARIVVQSILPTRSIRVPGERIALLNQQLAAIAQQDGAAYLDLYSYLVDRDGGIRQELTTDGIHLNVNGYGTWQSALWQAQTLTAKGG